MKSSWIARLFLLAASLAFCVSVARAQDNSRVVRLSRTDGQVLVSHPGNDTWDEAAVNLPLREGDTLATQGGMAEVEFENGATAYLAENSVLQFTQLGFSGDGRVTQLNLTQGAGSFYANPTRQDSFHVVTSTFEVAIRERAEVRVDAFRDGASIEVLSGEVSVSTSKGSTTFEKGESVAIHQDDLQNPKVARLPDQDAFDQWVSQQSEVIQSGSKNTLNYINSPNSYGLSDLAIYGSWVYLTGYGNSWRPFSAGFSWTPYLNGNWTRDSRLGWIWVSSEPWGWMPFHFGSWLLSPALGWVWVPGDPAGLRDWQGARVNWVRAGNQVGWVPKSPNDRDGAPANLQHGFMTTAGISQPNRNGSNQAVNGSNQVVAGKNLQNAAPLKQPPADLASSLVRPAPRSGPASIVRTIPQAREGSGSVVIERGTHTFINGNPSSVAVAPATSAQPRQPGPHSGGLPFETQGKQAQPGLHSGGLQAGPGPRSVGLPSEAQGKQAQPGLHSGGLQAQPAPESNARNEGRRVTIPPPGPMDSQTRRVNPPPAGPAPLSRMLPNGVNSPANSPSVAQPVRPGISPAQSMQVPPPRPMIPPAQPPLQPRYAPPAPAPQPPAAAPQTSSVARPAAPAQAGPEPARSTAGTTGRQR